MRPIKFRGKSLESGEWVHGYYTKSPKGTVYITPFRVGAPIKVDQETVGQWTGLLDSEGYKIYEGDILEFEHGGKCKAYVAYRDGAFDVKNEHQDVLLYLSVVSDKSEVIGNIYDDSELLDS